MFFLLGINPLPFPFGYQLSPFWVSTISRSGINPILGINPFPFWDQPSTDWASSVSCLSLNLILLGHQPSLVWA
jgi:hypothetical protein